MEQRSGNKDIDAFIKKTREESVTCDGFIEWIPIFDIQHIESLEQSGYSKIYSGRWNPFELSSLNIILKVLKNSKDFDHKFLNEFKIHYKCLGICAIPFYGLTTYPEMSDYAMVIKRATHGDLRNFLRSRKFKISWKERARILVDIAKSLNSLHKLDLVHRDFHCRNILVDDNMKIFIGDFGLSGPDRAHDVHLVVDILSKGLRPLIMSSIPKFYENIMKQCWHEDPSKRPDASQLIAKLDEFIELSKNEPIDIIQPSLLIMQKKPESEFSINQHHISKVDQALPRETVSKTNLQKSIKDELEVDEGNFNHSKNESKFWKNLKALTYKSYINGIKIVIYHHPFVYDLDLDAEIITNDYSEWGSYNSKFIDFDINDLDYDYSEEEIDNNAYTEEESNYEMEIEDESIYSEDKADLSIGTKGEDIYTDVLEIDLPELEVDKRYATQKYDFTSK
ncbi:7333_t:CDS:2, partial [Gigaspora margarita]